MNGAVVRPLRAASGCRADGGLDRDIPAPGHLLRVSRASSR